MANEGVLFEKIFMPEPTKETTLELIKRQNHLEIVLDGKVSILTKEQVKFCHQVYGEALEMWAQETPILLPPNPDGDDFMMGK